MGIKRKASALCEPSPLSLSDPTFFHHHHHQQPFTLQLPSSPPSLTSSASASSSPSSMTTEPYQTQLQPTPYSHSDSPIVTTQTSFPDWPHTQHKHSFAEPEWMGVRTSKRFRDNRPSEEIVYNETMRKLFDAQREHLDERADLPVHMGMEEGLVENGDMYGAGLGDGSGNGSGSEGWEGDTMVDSEALDDSELAKVEPKQRSIHDFFGGKRPDLAPAQVDQASVVDLESDGMDIDEPPRLSMDVEPVRMNVTSPTRGVWGESQMQRFWANRPVRLATDFRS